MRNHLGSWNQHEEEHVLWFEDTGEEVNCTCDCPTCNPQDWYSSASFGEFSDADPGL